MRGCELFWIHRIASPVYSDEGKERERRRREQRQQAEKSAEGERFRRRKRNLTTQLLLHDDDCFVCQDGGLLIMCDFCPKAYRLECVERTELPHGQWKCPWHFCNVCEGNSNIQCEICPNHLDLNFRIESTKFFCKEHSKVDICNYYLLHSERDLDSDCVDVKPMIACTTWSLSLFG